VNIIGPGDWWAAKKSRLKAISVFTICGAIERKTSRTEARAQ
jgi:hypothetical protein